MCQNVLFNRLRDVAVPVLWQWSPHQTVQEWPPQSAEQVVGTVNKIVCKLFPKLSQLECLEGHEGCFDRTLFADPVGWMQTALSKAMVDWEKRSGTRDANRVVFPTRAHFFYMSDQRTKSGLRRER